MKAHTLACKHPPRSQIRPPQLQVRVRVQTHPLRGLQMYLADRSGISHCRGHTYSQPPETPERVSLNLSPAWPEDTRKQIHVHTSGLGACLSCLALRDPSTHTFTHSQMSTNTHSFQVLEPPSPAWPLRDPQTSDSTTSPDPFSTSPHRNLAHNRRPSFAKSHPPPSQDTPNAASMPGACAGAVWC